MSPADEGMLRSQTWPQGWFGAHAWQRQALCGLTGLTSHAGEVGAAAGFPSRVFTVFAWERLQVQPGFLQHVDSEHWILCRHEHGQSLWLMSSPLSRLVSQRLWKAPESPRSTLCFLSSRGRTGFSRQFWACPPCLARLLSQAGHNFLLSPKVWGGKYENAAYNTGLRVFFAATELKLSAKEVMLSNCGAGEDSWESLGHQEDKISQS